MRRAVFVRADNGIEVTLADFYKAGREALKLSILAGAGHMGTVISEPAVNRPGLALTGFIGHVVVERCKTADVVADFLTVYINVAIVVHCTEIEQRMATVLLGVIERFLVPDGTLVEEQSLRLRVPVARHIHGRCLVEVVLYQVFRPLHLCVLEESPAVQVHAVVVVALLLHVDDVIPLAIE